MSANLTNRLRRLEEPQKAAPVSYVITTVLKQWLNALIKSINQGTPSPPLPPRRNMSCYSPAQLAVIASTKAWMETKINEHKFWRVDDELKK